MIARPAALAQLTPVLPLLDRLREAGAAIMPEVWHYITAAQIVPGVPVPPNQAPSPQARRAASYRGTRRDPHLQCQRLGQASGALMRVDLHGQLNILELLFCTGVWPA